ncbi:hypothetical protein KGP36_00985 [Patescibacteria group bacterium]|nr:hypothetical protein [Patescibacteria group bacterium]
MSKESPRSGIIASIVFACILLALTAFIMYESIVYKPLTVSYSPALVIKAPRVPPLDIRAYNKKMIELANFGTTTLETGIAATSSAWLSTSSSISSPYHRWPAPAPYPLPGAILPFNRIVAYYGNFYSAQMGILGELPENELIDRLLTTAADWQIADPSTPVIPAIDYIAVVAQGSAGTDRAYRLRMPDSQIEKAIAMADQIHGLVFLDVQVGLSSLQSELPLLESYLEKSNVELAIDPEFSMKSSTPGKVIGTFNADDVNYAASFLADIVRKHGLAPKILLVHRFTRDMVTGSAEIRPLPEVEIVMNMDGWGAQDKKIGTYGSVITPYPIQFAGIKLFYKNDARPPSTGLLTPSEVLSLKPQPIFIEYQ